MFAGAPVDQGFIERHLDLLLELVHEAKGSSTWTKGALLEGAPFKWDLSRTILDRDGNPVGFLLAYVQPSLNTLMFNEPNVFLRRLVIARQHRRRGLGRRLFMEWGQSVREVATRHSVGWVSWQTNTRDRDAHRFFDSLGFQCVGVISNNHRSDSIFWVSYEDFCTQLRRLRKGQQ